jgi:hypothetical protein
MSINIDVTKTSLATVPEQMLDYAMEVLLDQAHLMVGLWQIYIHVDTGSARDSIRVERGGEGLGWRQVRVRGGGYTVNPKHPGHTVDYMGVLEAKYGAGKQAWEEVEPTILEMLKNRVVEGLTEK